jgi:predicted peptidase
MKLNSFVLMILLANLATGTPTALGEDQPQKSVRVTVQVPLELNYLLYVPTDYEKQESWPLLIFLHGGGERGDDLELVKFHGPPKLIAAGKEFPFIVASPQCRKGRWWQPTELVALIDELSGKFKIDQDRVYVTGLSMGGIGSWELAGHAPDRIAAIAPICGGGETHWTRSMGKMPVWAFHGAKDKSVPIERMQTMIDALKKNGSEPKFTIYPEAEHDSWTETYNNPALYEWLLSQRRTPNK